MQNCRASLSECVQTVRMPPSCRLLINGSARHVMYGDPGSQSEAVPQEEEEKDGGKLCFHHSKTQFYEEVPRSSTLVLGRTGALFGTRTRFSISSTASAGTSTNGRDLLTRLRDQWPTAATTNTTAAAAAAAVSEPLVTTHTSHRDDDEEERTEQPESHTTDSISRHGSSEPSSVEPDNASNNNDMLPQLMPSSPHYFERDTARLNLDTVSGCFVAQDYHKMIEVLNEINAVTFHLSPDVRSAVHFGYGLAHFRLSDYNKASTEFQEVERISLANSSIVGNACLANYYLAEIYIVWSGLEKAAELYEKARTFYHPGRTTVAELYQLTIPSISTLLVKKASTLRKVSKIVGAVSAYKEAIDVAQSDKDRLSAHTSLGNLYQSVGDNTNAMKHYKTTLKLAWDSSDYVAASWAHGNLGNVFLSFNQKEKALYHLREALELTVKYEPTPQAIGRAYNNLGTAYQSLGDYEEAEKQYDEALNQAIYSNDTSGQARVLGNKANLCLLQERRLRAIELYTEALSIANDKSTRSVAYHNRGSALYEEAESRRKAFMEAEGIPVVTTFHGPDVEGLGVRLNQECPPLPEAVLSYYKRASEDFQEVVWFHEETLQSMKGSSKGLTLSVSLFETNSKTFHRLQDCLYSLGQLDETLVVAEQCRARTLGELLLKRKTEQLHSRFKTPLTFESICDIVREQNCDVVYFSYTKTRMFVWVLSPNPTASKVSVNMFQVFLEGQENMFEGRSLDFHLYYSLVELLSEQNLHLYARGDYSRPSPLTVLYDVFGEPLLKVLQAVHPPPKHTGAAEAGATCTPLQQQQQQQQQHDVILIPDSYTHLMPVSALLDTAEMRFLGDNRFHFRIVPSLLTLGVVEQLPPVVVSVPEDSKSFCIVGNPATPAFKYETEVWNLGRIPFAEEEARWVGRLLRCRPLVHDEPTKPVVLQRMKTASVIHFATHGSAVLEFVALAGISRGDEPASDKAVLLYSGEVEQLDLSPALVVLSSCDSGRGAVKADGIMGMSRAFILAGAQAVLTTLWKVPDESAAVFMQLFYQFLVDGFKSSLALQKAVRSLRCFQKYSQYIHWSGYQLLGRDIEVKVTRTAREESIGGMVEGGSVFPRSKILQQLQENLLHCREHPSYVQVLQGVHGTEPQEPVQDFILQHHAFFTGGIYWVGGATLRWAEQTIKRVMPRGAAAVVSETSPALVVLDCLYSLPPPDSFLFSLLHNSHTHIVLVATALPVERIVKEIDRHLMRGCDATHVGPLSAVHSTQRIAYALVRNVEGFFPMNREQRWMEQLADLTRGSPCLVDASTAVVSHRLKCQGSLESWVSEVITTSMGEEGGGGDGGEGGRGGRGGEGEGGKETGRLETFAAQLIKSCRLTATGYLLLRAASIPGPVPIPEAALREMESFLIAASGTVKPEAAAGSILDQLLSLRLLRRYPSPVLARPEGSSGEEEEEELVCYYVPVLLVDGLWAKRVRSYREDRLVSGMTCVSALGRTTSHHVTTSRSSLKILTETLLNLCRLQLQPQESGPQIT